MISGIVISLTGIAHNAFAPAMYHMIMKDQLTKDKAAGIIFFFIVAGTAFLFAGLFTMFSSVGLKKSGKSEKYLLIRIFLEVLLKMFLKDFKIPGFLLVITSLD